MKTRVSALMDSELVGYEIAYTLRAMRCNQELRSEWCDGQLIGAALRGEDGLDIDVTARVMSAIHMEPTVVVPAQRRALAWQRPALALAASATGVALVAWLVLAPVGDGVATRSAQLAAVKQAPVAQSTPRLQEYLLAHQAYAPGGALVGGARNIRTVAASGEGR